MYETSEILFHVLTHATEQDFRVLPRGIRSRFLEFLHENFRNYPVYFTNCKTRIARWNASRRRKFPSCRCFFSSARLRCRVVLETDKKSSSPTRFDLAANQSTLLDEKNGPRLFLESFFDCTRQIGFSWHVQMENVIGAFHADLTAF